jgi:hypothetical protein
LLELRDADVLRVLELERAELERAAAAVTRGENRGPQREMAGAGQLGVRPPAVPVIGGPVALDRHRHGRSHAVGADRIRVGLAGLDEVIPDRGKLHF